MKQRVVSVSLVQNGFEDLRGEIARLRQRVEEPGAQNGVASEQDVELRAALEQTLMRLLWPITSTLLFLIAGFNILVAVLN